MARQPISRWTLSRILPITSAGVSLADPDRPVPAEMRYDAWREISGVRFPTHRINSLSGVKRGEVTMADIHVNIGLRPQDLAAKPADFAPDIAGRSRNQEGRADRSGASFH